MKGRDLKGREVDGDWIVESILKDEFEETDSLE